VGPKLKDLSNYHREGSIMSQKILLERSAERTSLEEDLAVTCRDYS